eukprot:1446141-Pyramimonas_sp.AAC.1
MTTSMCQCPPCWRENTRRHISATPRIRHDIYRLRRASAIAYIGYAVPPSPHNNSMAATSNEINHNNNNQYQTYQ